MACVRIAFPELEWTAGGHPLERKKVAPDTPVVMLEFAPGFADPAWCPRSHIIFVISGSLELELDAGVTIVGPGEACVIDAGTRHRARNPGTEPAVLFVASDVTPQVAGVAESAP